MNLLSAMMWPCVICCHCHLASLEATWCFLWRQHWRPMWESGRKRECSKLNFETSNQTFSQLAMSNSAEKPNLIQIKSIQEKCSLRPFCVNDKHKVHIYYFYWRFFYGAIHQTLLLKQKRTWNEQAYLERTVFKSINRLGTVKQRAEKEECLSFSWGQENIEELV